MPLLILHIQHYAIHDGPGIRTTVFLKGCPLRCRWCHNPESQESVIEQVMVKTMLDGKEFETKSVVGRWQSADDVLKEIEKDAVFYSESGGGVTFSGGEPLLQADGLTETANLCRQKGFHIAIDTCGHAEPVAVKKMMDLADLWLFDLKLMDDAKHVEYTGVSNELALKNLETLANAGKNIIIRFPVIPGITDDRENLAEIVKVMHHLRLDRIDLLPYHAIARDKYRRIGRPYLLEDKGEPAIREMEHLAEYFKDNGMKTN